MNGPIQIAKAIYSDAGRNFEEEFCECLRAGFVGSAPNYFLMGKPVELPGEYLNGKPRHAWLVAMAVGNLADIIRAVPFTLPHLAFYRPPSESHPKRDGYRLHVLPMSKFMKKGSLCHS